MEGDDGVILCGRQLFSFSNLYNSIVDFAQSDRKIFRRVLGVVRVNGSCRSISIFMIVQKGLDFLNTVGFCLDGEFCLLFGKDVAAADVFNACASAVSGFFLWANSAKILAFVA